MFVYLCFYMHRKVREFEVIQFLTHLLLFASLLKKLIEKFQPRSF